MTPRSAILGFIAVLFATAASAATYTVLPNGGGDFAKIQDAIDAAVSGDVIVLGDGVFTGSRNRDLRFLGKNLTLRSQSGNPALCAIDCQGQSRGININQGETSVLVQGITIRNGFAPRTPAIPSSPGWGGGLNLSGVTATFRFCVIASCTADDGPGGALGAGAYASSSNVTFEVCSFTDNYFALRGTGAGLFAWQSSNVTATQCSFDGNRAAGITSGGTGGGVQVQDSRLTMLDCEVRGNMAHIGAGISTGQLCIVDIRDCLIAGNSNNTTEGTRMGAGIHLGYDTDGVISGCTITGNRAYERGAGVTVANDGNVTIENTVIWGNCIGAGVGESVSIATDGFVDFACCDVDPAKVVGGTATYTSSFAADPVFCNAKPCAGAPTLEGNYSLQGTSPLIEGSGCGLIGSENAICDVLGIGSGPIAGLGLELRAGPNPFRDATSIRYSIAVSGPVAVDVFDAAGRLVRRFDEGMRRSGSYTIPWNGRSAEGSSVPPGVYFARISSRGQVATGWIVRVK